MPMMKMEVTVTMVMDMVRCRLHLEIYEDELVVEYSAKLGETLLNELRLLEDTYPDLVSNARGRGLFCALDLPDGETRDRLVKRLFENRLIMLGCGDRSIRFRPALNIPEEDLFRGLDIIRKVLTEES